MNAHFGLSGNNYSKDDKRSGREVLTENSQTVEDVYVGSWPSRVDVITAIGIAFGTAHPVRTDCVLAEIEVVRVSPEYADFFYRYRMIVPPGTTPPVGTVILEADTNTGSDPIGQHPLVSAANYDENRAIGIDDWEGITHYLTPAPVYKRTEILDTFEFSEANIIDDVAKIDNTPEDMVSPTEDRWLKTGQAVRQVGTKYEKVEVWQYNKEGWTRSDNFPIYESVE